MFQLWHMSQWMVPGLTDYIRSHWSQEPPLNIPSTTTEDRQANRQLHEHTDWREWVLVRANLVTIDVDWPYSECLISQGLISSWKDKGSASEEQRRHGRQERGTIQTTHSKNRHPKISQTQLQPVETVETWWGTRKEEERRRERRGQQQMKS